MKARLLVLIFYFACCTPLIAQLQYNGVIKDAKTKKALPYVNVGVLNKGVGTVTDEEGRFVLAINRNRIALNDTLQISSIGYKTIKKAIGDIDFSLRKGDKILMETDIVALNEVVLSAGSEQIRQKKVGYYFSNSRKIGYWRGITSLGAEMVTKIRVNKRPRQLNEFSFHVLQNFSDSLLVRVNVYRGDTPFPEIKLTKKNIIFTLTKKSGKVTFDLTPYDLYVNDDFSIGLELLDVYGKRVNLTLLASDDPGTSYRRYASQGEWKRFRNDALTFYLNTTVFAKDDLLAEVEDDGFYRQSSSVKGILPNQISGIVFNNGSPLPNVDVKVQGKGFKTTTDENGRYRITAELGDEVTFDFLDMESVSRTVLETTFGINVSMETKVTALDNVTVTERKKLKKTQEELFMEYNTNPNLIKTGFGILDKVTSGVSLYILDEGEFKSTAINILEAVNGKFPGVKIAALGNPRKLVSPYDFNAVLYARGSGSLLNPRPMIYEIDGLINTEVPRHIDMNSVKRMAVLQGLAAAAKYGSIAAGGIVVINTKVGNYSPRNDKKATDPLQVHDNIYLEDALSREQVRRNWPKYLQELYANNSFNEAMKTFNSYAHKFSSSPSFFVDTYIYFKHYWKKDTEIDSIIAENADVFGDNISALTALAYAYEKSGELKRAELVYKRIFRLRPNHAQSYLDLARNYVASGAFEKALGLYSRYNYLLNQEFLKAGPEGPHSIILTEFTNLIQRKGKQILPDSEEIIEIDTEAFKGTRIVVDWNDPDADFELQFVNPRNRFFTWSSTKSQNKNDNTKQVSSKEYFIDDYMMGDWLVNVNYKGSNSLYPIYMKATIFFDYGRPSQRSTVKVFRLRLKNANQQLFKLSGNPITATK